LLNVIQFGVFIVESGCDATEDCMSTVEIVLKEGPVLSPSLAGSGVDRVYRLWDDISASEFFPPRVESAFYVLSRRKPVRDTQEVAEAEDDLVSALRLLVTAWPFSGGSFTVLDSREMLVSPRLESNAEHVRAELLASGGKTLVARSVAMRYESLATYDRPLREVASAVARAAMNRPGLRRLLYYHHAVWTGYYGRAKGDRSSWFTDLYKVRDLLKKLYGGEEAAKAQLAISAKDWNCFGKILNKNDLRHAEVAGVVPQIPEGDVRRLYGLARTWTQSHLKAFGLPLA
jgi:hypothetical protein